MTSAAWPKVCGCGESFSLEAWLKLPELGRMDEDEHELSLKNCPRCDSTLAVYVIDLPPDEDDARLAFELRRQRKVEGYYKAAWKCLELATVFLTEDRLAGADVSQRVRDCVSQVGEYRKAIRRERALRFGGDVVLRAVDKPCLRLVG